MNRTAALIAGAALSLAGTALAASPETILQRTVDARSERLEGVETVAIRKTVLGLSHVEYFGRHRVTTEDGRTIPVLRSLSAGEAKQTLAGKGQPEQVGPEQLSGAASAIRKQSKAIDGEMSRQMNAANIPSPLQKLFMSAPADQPWLSPNPADMMNLYATMLDAGAEGQVAQAEAAARSRQNAGDELATFRDLGAVAQLVGLETLDGRDVHHLRAEGLDQVQQADGQTFRLETMSLWIDAEHYVPLRMLVEGVAEEGNQQRPLTIERLDQDYRQVPGSRLYEPYYQVMRIQGMMNEAQRAEMEQASRQLADAKRQLEALPEAQRRMVMGRMGPQLEQLEALASGNGLEIVTQVQEIQVNAPLSTAGARPPGPAGVAAFIPGAMQPTTLPRDTAGTSEAAAFEAQRACLEDKAAAARETQRKRRGFGRLLGAVDRVASRAGDFATRRIVNDVFQVDATANDLQAAARDLGLTPDAIEACRNP